MSSALVESIALIDKILSACDDPSAFVQVVTKSSPIVPQGAVPKQGKKDKKKKPVNDSADSAKPPVVQDPISTADLRVRFMNGLHLDYIALAQYHWLNVLQTGCLNFDASGTWLSRWPRS